MLTFGLLGMTVDEARAAQLGVDPYPNMGQWVLD